MKRITFSPPRHRSRDDRWTMQLDGQTVAIISSRCALEALEDVLAQCTCIAPAKAPRSFRIEAEHGVE